MKNLALMTVFNTI